MAKALGCLEFAGLEACHDALIAAVATLPQADDAMASLIASGVMR
jgi:hypothetical protein